MAQPGTDQHEGGVAVREAAHHTGTAADLPVEPLNDVIGTDASPVFTGKIAVSQRFLNAVPSSSLWAVFLKMSRMFLSSARSGVAVRSRVNSGAK